MLRIALLPFLMTVPMFAGLIAIDENGNGLPHVIGTDPGPGGRTGVLIYTLPFTGVQGDVLLADADCHCVLDVLRFNGNGTVIFYSDNVDGVDAIGDTSAPPAALYRNAVIGPEIGLEGNNFGAPYTPTSTQPGFDLSHPTYLFVSDGALAPEPGTWGLILAGFSLFSYRWFRRRFRASDNPVLENTREIS